MGDVYLTQFLFTATGLEKVVAGFTATANGLKAKAAAMGSAIGKALTAPIAAAVVGIAATMGAAGATKEFMDFEQASSSAVARLGLNVSRTAESIRADLEKGLDVTIDESNYVKALDNVQSIQRELGATTAFTATQVGQGIENIAAMGADVLNLTAEGYKPFLDLSSATSTSLDETSSIVMSTLRSFNLYDDQLTNSSRVTDVFAKACGMSALDMNKISNAMNYIGPVAAQYGVNLEEVTAQMALLANAGYDGSMAGTALRGAYMRLTSPTEEVQVLLKKAGVGLDQINPRYNHMTDILKTLGDAFNLSNAPIEEAIGYYEKLAAAGMEDEKIVEEMKKSYGDIGAIFEIFGARAAPAMLAMFNQMGDFETFYDNLVNSAGAAGTMAAQKLDNLAGSITILKSALSDLGIEIGSYFAPHLRNLAEWLTATGIPAVKSFFQALHEGDWGAVGKKLAKFGVWMVEGLVNSLLGLGTKIKDVLMRILGSDTLKPVVDNFSALILTAFVVLKTNIIGILAGLAKSVILSFASMAAKSVAALAPLVARVVSTFATMAVSVLGHLARMVSSVVLAFIGMASKSIASLILMSTQVASNFLSMAIGSLLHVGTMVTNVLTSFALMAREAIAKVAAMVAPILASFATMAAGAVAALSPLLLPIAAVAAVIAGIGLAAGALPGVGKKFKEFGGKVKAAVSDVWKSISEGNYSEAFDKIKNYIKKAVSEIKKYLQSGKIKEDAQKVFDGLKIAFEKGVEVIVKQAKNLGEKLKEALSEAIKNAVGEAKFEELSNKFNEVKNKIIETIETIKEPFEKVWESLKEKATSALEEIKGAFGPAFSEIKQTVETVKTALSSMFDENNDKANNFISVISQIIAKFVEWAGSAAIGAVKVGLEFVANALRLVFQIINDYVIPALGWLYDKIIIVKDAFWAWAGDFITACWDVAKNAASFKEGLVNIFKIIAAYVLAKVAQLKDEMTNKFKEAFNLVVTDAFLFKKDLTEAFDGLQESLQGPISTITGWINSLSSSIGGAIESAKQLLGLSSKQVYEKYAASGDYLGTGVYTPEEAEKWKAEQKGRTLEPVKFSNLDKLNQVPILRTVTPGEDKSIETNKETGETVVVEVDTSNVEKAFGETAANGLTLGLYGLVAGGSSLWGSLTGKAYKPETYNVNRLENMETIDEIIASIENGTLIEKEGQKLTVQSSDFLKDTESNSSDTAASSSEIAKNTEHIANTEENRRMWEEKYGLDADKVKEVFEKGLQDEIAPHLIELKNKDYSEYLAEYFEKFGLDFEKTLDVDEDTLKITDKNGKTLLELESLSKYTNEELGQILDEVTTTADNTTPPIESAEKTSLENAAESLEETRKSLSDPMFYESFFGNNLDYIQKIQELAAIGHAHPAQIAHAAQLSEQIRESLINAYQTLGTIPNEMVAKIVGLDMSQFEPLPVDVEAESIEVPKSEEVNVNANAIVSEESTNLLATQIEAVDPTVTANTEINEVSLAETVSTVESQKPQVGVYLYIAQNITIPSSVNIGVNYYPLNSPSDFSTTSENLVHAASGAYTGNYSGPMWVDPNEVILNEAQRMGLLKTLAGNNNKANVEIHNHYDLSGTVITGFKDVDVFIEYANEKAYAYWRRQKNEI